MKQKLRNFIQHIIATEFRKNRDLTKNDSDTQIVQKQLESHYKFLTATSNTLPETSEVGWRKYSQTDEDGILHFIFSVIGTTDKICLDIAFANPVGANTTNLILNNAWNGILICGDKSEAEFATEYFSNRVETKLHLPYIDNKWVTKDNINEIVKEGLENASFTKDTEVDFLSLDIDGIDYWIWESLKVNPRVVVVEYQDILGEKLLTVPYSPDFNRFDTHKDFFGASLPAFVKLAKSKGYRLVACNKFQYNAFFVRNDISPDLLPEIETSECLKHPKVKQGIKNRYPAVKGFNWVKV